jgi:hypothetical protein
MAFSIDAWNVSPNRLWFAKLADSGSNIQCGLYLTEADAAAGTNRQANGSCGYGSGVQLVLAADSGATVAVEYFQSGHAWHLKVSGSVSSATKVFRVAEFVELDEISHPIYRNEDLITSRATAEIDAHTHATIRKEIALGSHDPTLEPGDIVRLNSTRRGKNELLQVMEHRISAEVSDGGEMSLTSAITAAGYLELKR